MRFRFIKVPIWFEKVKDQSLAYEERRKGRLAMTNKNQRKELLILGLLLFVRHTVIGMEAKNQRKESITILDTCIGMHGNAMGPSSQRGMGGPSMGQGHASCPGMRTLINI